MQIEIKTERLVLRPLGTKYLQTTFKYSSDIENTRLMIYLPNETIEEAKTFLNDVEAEWKKEAPSFYEFAVLVNEVHIGAISIYLDEKRRTGELAWILDKDYWRQGYITEAAQALVDYATKELDVHHFIAYCDSENVGSYKVMEKLGMQLTDSYSGRKNRASDEIRKEYLYEMNV